MTFEFFPFGFHEILLVVVKAEKSTIKCMVIRWMFSYYMMPEVVLPDGARTRWTYWAGNGVIGTRLAGGKFSGLLYVERAKIWTVGFRLIYADCLATLEQIDLTE